MTKRIGLCWSQCLWAQGTRSTASCVSCSRPASVSTRLVAAGLDGHAQAGATLASQGEALAHTLSLARQRGPCRGAHPAAAAGRPRPAARRPCGRGPAARRGCACPAGAGTSQSASARLSATQLFPPPQAQVHATRRPGCPAVPRTPAICTTRPGATPPPPCRRVTQRRGARLREDVEPVAVREPRLRRAHARLRQARAALHRQHLERGGAVRLAPEWGRGGAPRRRIPGLAYSARAPRSASRDAACWAAPTPGALPYAGRKRAALRTHHRAYVVLPPRMAAAPRTPAGASARARPHALAPAPVTNPNPNPELSGPRRGGTLPARKKAAAARVRKQRSVAHSVQRSAAGRPSAPGGSSADTTSGSSSAATWLDTVISACRAAGALSLLITDRASAHGLRPRRAARWRRQGSSGRRSRAAPPPADTAHTRRDARWDDTALCCAVSYAHDVGKALARRAR
jgi:hypothetical protein